MSALTEMIERNPIFQNVRCGVDIGPGWVPIVERLGQQLTALGGVVVTQVKEKFGGLRCYHEGVEHEGSLQEYDYEAAEALVKAAEDECAVACEQCGAPGHRRLLTLCDEHHNERLRRMSR
jgi:hypothetical protein